MEGHMVRALVRRTSDRSFLKTLTNLEFAEGSVEDRASLSKAMWNVDAVVHSAGIVKARSEAEFFACNTDGTRNLLEAAMERGPSVRKFVHVSSLEACGPAYDGKPVPCEQERPVTAYGRSKLAAEKECLRRKGSLPIVILRPAAIYGPRDNEILEAFRAARRRQYPVIGDGRMVGSYTYATDCAQACIRALEANVPSGSVYFVDDGNPLTMARAMGEIVPQAVGTKPWFRIGIPMTVLRAASVGLEAYARVSKHPVMLTREKVAMLSHDWVCDSQATRKDLSWKPAVSFLEGAELTARWYQENGRL